jgi:hypothetical protein
VEIVWKNGVKKTTCICIKEEKDYIYVDSNNEKKSDGKVRISLMPLCLFFKYSLPIVYYKELYCLVISGFDVSTNKGSTIHMRIELPFV